MGQFRFVLKKMCWHIDVSLSFLIGCLVQIWMTSSHLHLLCKLLGCLLLMHGPGAEIIHRKVGVAMWRFSYISIGSLNSIRHPLSQLLPDVRIEGVASDTFFNSFENHSLTIMPTLCNNWPESIFLNLYYKLNNINIKILSLSFFL